MAFETVSDVVTTIIGGATLLGIGAAFSAFMGRYLTNEKHAESINKIQNDMSMMALSIKEMADILKEQRAIVVKIDMHTDAIAEVKEQVKFLQVNGCHAHYKNGVAS